MDNNNPINPTPPAQPTAFTPQADPTVLQQPPQQPLTSGPVSKGNNKLVMIVVGLIILVVVLVGAYFYLGQTQVPEPSPSPKPAQTQTKEESIQKELDAIDVEASENDFQEVDKDLQSL